MYNNNLILKEKQFLPSDNVNMLIESFLVFCSYLFNNIKNVESIYYSKLCMLIFICLTEDESFNQFIHHKNYLYDIPIFYVNFLLYNIHF